MYRTTAYSIYGLSNALFQFSGEIACMGRIFTEIAWTDPERILTIGKNCYKTFFFNLLIWHIFKFQVNKNNTDSSGGLTILSMALFGICTIIPQISSYSKIWSCVMLKGWKRSFMPGYYISVRLHLLNIENKWHFCRGANNFVLNCTYCPIVSQHCYCLVKTAHSESRIMVQQVVCHCLRGKQTHKFHDIKYLIDIF